MRLAEACICAPSVYGFDLIFDLSVVVLTVIILYRLHLENHKMYELILSRGNGWGYGSTSL